MEYKLFSTISLNEDQIALARWISSGLNINEVRNLKGDASYLLNNMIAKFISASPTYHLSKKTVISLQANKINLQKRYKRSRFYGKSKSPSYVYEHSVPCSLVRKELMKAKKDFESHLKVLIQAGPVVMITREEDEKLNSCGLKSVMPPGWEWGHDNFDRYKKAGIELSTKMLLVEGAICR